MWRRLGEHGESLRIAFTALVANRTRGALTTLGIVIGIVGVITTMTAANGLSNSFQESVSALGSDVLYVSRTPWVIRGNFFEFRNRPPLELDVATSLGSLDQALAVNPTIETDRPVKYASTALPSISVIGTTDKHVVVSTWVPAVGRFLTGMDVQLRKRVVVIGDEVKNKLFGEANALNREIKVGRFDYRVIGVMEKQGGGGFFGGPNFDSQAFVPVTSFVKDFGGQERDFNIAVKAKSGVRLDDLEYELIGAMRKIRRLTPEAKDNFSINKMTALVGMFNNVMGVVVLVGVLITGISLFVGGIGVMNVMFVSVTERTREIGTRRALGARKSTILTQFLFESSAVCMVGGMIGLALAYLITEVIRRTLLPASISPVIVVIAIVVSIAVGVLAGLVPALRAARLNPIEALRHE